MYQKLLQSVHFLTKSLQKGKGDIFTEIECNYRTNRTESLRMLTRLLSVFVGSLPCGTGYGN